MRAQHRQVRNRRPASAVRARVACAPRSASDGSPPIPPLHPLRSATPTHSSRHRQRRSRAHGGPHRPRRSTLRRLGRRRQRAHRGARSGSNDPAVSGQPGSGLAARKVSSPTSSSKRLSSADETVELRVRSDHNRRAQGRSKMTAIVSRTWANASGPTFPSVSTTRAGETARTCWHCAADDCSRPLAGSGSMTTSV